MTESNSNPGKSPSKSDMKLAPGKDDVAPRTLSLVKGQHRFCFTYRPGEESTVLDSLVSMVHRRELPFDWFDAAVLSHQLGQHLAKELMTYLPKKAA
jgi:hypothetical protein